MSHLSLVGVSEDGDRLLLVSDQGDEFTLDITPTLRAALRGQTARLGQLEMQMSSTLRPRDIQHRIRGGESPEEVAEAAGTTVDAIMAYAAPVLAERQHIAERAQHSSLRRQNDSPSAPHLRQLGEAVAAHLAANDARPDQVTWDSHRREDGRWVVTAHFEIADSRGSARFVYDAPGNYVSTDNDDARVLIGEGPRSAATPVAGQRHLSAVADQLPLGDDAIDMVTEADAARDLAERESSPMEQPGGGPIADHPPTEPATGHADDTERTPDTPSDGDSDGDSDDPTDDRTDDEADDGTDTEPSKPPQRRTPAKKRGRASVPSWDEIMFGGGDK